MSLIRYSSDDSRSVVLRHQQTLVLYDPHSRQIILREASPTSPIEGPVPQTCPYCKRPMHHNDEPASDPLGPSLGHRSRSSTQLAESGFVDQHYFRMLDSSIPVEGSDTREPRRSIPLPRLQPERSQGSGDEGHSEEEELAPNRDAGIKASAFSPGYFKRFFVTERELGRGGKGVVLLVRHVLDSVSLGNFACKRVPVGNNHEWLEKVLMEVQLLQRLSHSNLVSYRHVWLENAQISAFGPSVPCAFILQQYCNSGDLHNYILGSIKQPTNESRKERLRRKSRGQLEPPESTVQPRRLPFNQIISFFRDIAQGLNHLHSNGFIHRDLKPSNCLLHNTGIPGEELKVLVSDFGEVQVENQARKSTGNTGTISYCAPEVLKRAPGGTYENFTTKSDIFSLGMILHFICFGKLPYAGADSINEENEDLDALRAEISAWRGLDDREKRRLDLPERLYHSLKALINPDPAMRPSAEDIVHGIEMGIGEDSPPLRRTPHKSPSVMDEGPPFGFKRISPVADTPRAVTPVDPLDALLNREALALNGNGNLAADRRDTTSKILRTPSKLSQCTTSPGSPPQASTSGEAAIESSMILRPQPEFSGSIESGQPTFEIPPVNPRWRRRLYTPQTFVWLKIAVFFIKLLSLAHPCIPAAPKPLVYYPMIMIATLDFFTTQMSIALCLCVLHVMVLLLVRTFGGLCMY